MINIFGRHSIFSNCTATFIFLVVFFIGVLPFFILSFYTLPNLEDYAESIIPSIWWHVKFLYLTYDGRYFVSFLFAALNPLKSQSYLGYQLIPVALLVSLFSALFLLYKSILKKPKSSFVLCLTALVFLMLLHRNPNISYSFYYMISSYVYMVPLIMFIFLLVALQKHAQSTSEFQKLIYLLAAVFLIVTIAGSNELLLIPILVVIACFSWLQFKKGYKNEIALLWITILCSYFVVFTSPGIHEYIEQEGERVGVITPYLIAIQKSIDFSSYHLMHLLKLNFALLLSSVLFVLYLLKNKDQLGFIQKSITPTRFGFSVVIYVVFVLLVAFPYCWAAGEKASSGYSQAFIITYCFGVVGWFLLLLGLAALIARNYSSFTVPNWSMLFLVILLALSIMLDKKSNIRIAYDDLISKKAQMYYQEMKNNIYRSENNEQFVDENNVLELCAINHKPSTIFSLYLNPNDEGFYLEYRMFYDIDRLEVVNCIDNE